MKKAKSLSIYLSLVLLFLFYSRSALADIFIFYEKESITELNRENNIKIYSMTRNRHGAVVKTSVGIFYLGKSKDAIHSVSGIKRYGYWEGDEHQLRIYIEKDVYAF